MTASRDGRRDLLDIYDRSDYLDAKWGVIRRFRISEDAFEDWVVGLLGPPATAVVLDIGAGAGRFILPLARRLAGGGRVDAVDVSENVMTALVATASEEGLPVGTTVADVEEHPFPEDTYDAIVAGHMLVSPAPAGGDPGSVAAGPEARRQLCGDHQRASGHA